MLKNRETDSDEITLSVCMSNRFGKRVVMITWRRQQTKVEEGGEKEEEGDSFGRSSTEA